MNIYTSLNEMLEYIEENLGNEIKYSELAKILGINESILQRFFSVLCNISLSDYIRKRRLSNAGQDLIEGREKIIDIAMKYQYESSTSFSRAFEKFHGIKPSQVKKGLAPLKIFYKLHFEEKNEENENIQYTIIEREKMILYGMKVETSIEGLKKDAPYFCKEMSIKYGGDFRYGMTEYVSRFGDDKCYFWALYDEYKKGFEEYKIPESKWISIRINSQEAKDIQKTIRRFYAEFIPSSKYKIRELPELEYYHDNITDFLVPIEV